MVFDAHEALRRFRGGKGRVLGIALRGALLFELVKGGGEGFMGVFEGGVEGEAEECEEDEEEEEGDVVFGFPVAEGGAVGDEGEEGRDGNDGVVTGSLPVGAAEMEPHSEFVEGEGETDAVGDGGGGEFVALGAGEDEVGAAEGEEEDAVVEVVDVGAGDVEEELRGEFSGHDVDDEDAGGDEGEEEGGEDDAGEVVGEVGGGEGGGWVSGIADCNGRCFSQWHGIRR